MIQERLNCTVKTRFKSLLEARKIMALRCAPVGWRTWPMQVDTLALNASIKFNPWNSTTIPINRPATKWILPGKETNCNRHIIIIIARHVCKSKMKQKRKSSSKMWSKCNQVSRTCWDLSLSRWSSSRFWVHSSIIAHASWVRWTTQWLNSTL